MQLVLYFCNAYNHVLNTFVDHSFKSEPFFLNSFKLTLQSNYIASRNLFIFCSSYKNKQMKSSNLHEVDYHNHMLKIIRSSPHMLMKGYKLLRANTE